MKEGNNVIMFDKVPRPIKAKSMDQIMKERKEKRQEKIDEFLSKRKK